MCGFAICTFTMSGDCNNGEMLNKYRRMPDATLWNDRVSVIRARAAVLLGVILLSGL